MSEVVIDERFCGLPRSANGGYTCGLIARFIEGPAQVTLRSPPPLGRALTIRPVPDGTVALLDRDSVVAEAVSADVDRSTPEPVTLEEARVGAERYEWAQIADHPYPTCFVCGPARASGDGLRIFPGPVPARDLYAAPWRPDDSLLDAEGLVRAEFVWAALDCPSGLVTNTLAVQGPILLGRLTVDVLARVPGDAEYVLSSWPLQRDGTQAADGLGAVLR